MDGALTPPWPLVPEVALLSGFYNEPMGTHTSRTLMLSELRGLLATHPGGDSDALREAVIDENVCRKAGRSTREKTFRHLRELYALTDDVVIWRALGALWVRSEDAQPLLALLCAVARDPLLRATSRIILETPEGVHMTSDDMAPAIESVFPGRLKADTLARTSRNVGSSWTQSGHLRGRTHKVRSTATTTPESTAYALFLGYICGGRGDALFRTPWALLTDGPEHILRAQAEQAGRLGYLEYRHGGGVTEVTFAQLLREGDAV